MPDETMIRIMQTCRTVAVVGFSRYPSKAGYYVPAYLQKQGYHIIPVNPHLSEGLGEKAYGALGTFPRQWIWCCYSNAMRMWPPLWSRRLKLAQRRCGCSLGIEDETAAATARSAGLSVVQDTCMLVAHRRWTGQ